MATYVPSFKGYINDVPELWFKRNDGKVYHFDELSDASVTPDVQFTEINGGWSLYPVAYLPAASTMEMQFTSAQFSADLFTMANNTSWTTDTTTVQQNISVNPGDFNEGDAYDSTTKKGLYSYTVDTAFGFDITSISIYGQDAGVTTKATAAVTTAIDEGAIQYFIEEGTSGSKDKVTFYLGNKAKYTQTIEFYTEHTVTASITEIDNKQTAVGELIMKYPVYANGDETTAAGVKGYVMVDVYKCRCTAMPGFDSSYKNGVTNAVTFSTMKPDTSVHGGAVYSIKYYDK